MNDGIRLGEQALYIDQYDASLLEPIPRKLGRQSNGFDERFIDGLNGRDVWTAYEVSWLNSRGKPLFYAAEFSFPCDSEAIVESKSFKYYLNSFNQTPFDSVDAVRSRLERDLSAACGGRVAVVLHEYASFNRVDSIPGECVDGLDIAVNEYHPDATLLRADGDVLVEQDMLFSRLLKSNCPVTGQPDWAVVWINYSGPRINPESFLRFVVSYRQHQDYHEQCVEKIFSTILAQCGCSELTVCARYTRRGGLDINPYRSTSASIKIPFGRLAHQ